MNVKPVVAINGKGNVVGYYGSQAEAARITGLKSDGISRAIREKLLYKRLRWMHESEYRELWMQGRTDELSYSYHQMRSERSRGIWAAASEEKKKQWRKNISEGRLRGIHSGTVNLENQRESRCKPVLCVNTGEVFESGTAFCEKMGLSRTRVANAVRKGHKAKGMIVKYITKEEYEQRRNQKDT